MLKAESVEVEILIQCPAQYECYQHKKQVDPFFLCHVFDLIGLMKLHWPIAWANVKQSSMPVNTAWQKKSMGIGQPALAPLADSCYLNIAPARPELASEGYNQAHDPAS